MIDKTTLFRHGFLPVAIAATLAVTASFAQTPESAPESAPAQAAAVHTEIAKIISPSIVRVEYTLRYDGSEAPMSRGWNQRCPNCGNYHSDRVEPMIRDERPLERSGFAIGPDRIVTAHLMVHPRFIDEIVVEHNGQRVTAQPTAYGVEQRAVVLTLAEPLDETQPLSFGADLDEALYAVAARENGGRWNTSVHPFSGAVLLRENGETRMSALSESVIVNAEGIAAGVVMTEDLPADGSWATSPEEWELVEIAAMENALTAQSARVDELLPRVSLRFRSPREEPDQMYSHMHRMFDDDDDGITEMEAVGMILAPEKILVLAHLSPAATARLERIRMHLPGNESPVSASFVATLADYGAFIAQTEEPLAGAIDLSSEGIAALPGRLLLATELEIRGEQRRIHHEPARIANARKGRHGAIFPDMAGDAENLFLFDLEGTLISFPLEVRERSIGDERRWRSRDRVLLPASLLADIMDDLDAHSDPANVPAEEGEEARLAWIGIDLQPLDPRLARDLNVSSQTNNGETGGLVSDIIPDSPAAKAGIEPGDILLRLRAEGLPRPFPVKLDSNQHHGEPFPWEYLDEITEEYYSYLTPPWSSHDNAFNRFLTELGFGRELVIESIRNGDPVQHTLSVEQGPPHYEAAPQYRSDEYGLTVRELTFETRRFFQKEDGAPGLIVARIEPGSSASSSGLKPFEVITHLNGEPVVSVQEFENTAEAENEMRLSVQRMHQGRITVLQKPAAR